MDEEVTRKSPLPPQESVGFLIRDSMMLLHKLLRTFLARHDISTAQWFLLRVLWEEEGLSQRELSERVNTTEPTTQSALLRMEKQGIIRRVKNAEDRRANRIYLTPKGRKLEAAMIPYAMEVNRVARDGLDDAEIEMLRALLNKMRANLQRETSQR
jgi:DNA-binding MarR family transcriptional regulator